MCEIIVSIGVLIIYVGYCYTIEKIYQQKYDAKIKHLEEQVEELKSYIYISKD